LFTGHDLGFEQESLDLVFGERGLIRRADNPATN
jgi:hypothetical protein